MATQSRGGHHHSFMAGQSNNKQAQLSNAYQELGRELSSEKLTVVGGYTIGRVIGEGTFGSVHLAIHRLSGTRCAVKKIPKAHTPALTREIHHHRRLHHLHIVHLYEIIATENHIWLVTELCSGGELFDYLVERGRMLEGEARRLFGELAVAVGWMHRRGVVHRDLKLENVLLDGELRVKLGDMGFAREWQRGRLMETFCGTTGYASPEMLAGRKYLGVETDIWSLGIILYSLLCGGLPFDDDDERVMQELIMKGEYEEPEWLGEDARGLIRAMLQHEPSQRPSIEAILTHPWFKSTLIDQLPTADHPEGHSVPASPHLGASSPRPVPVRLPSSPLARVDSNEPFNLGSPDAGSSRLLSPDAQMLSLPPPTNLPPAPPGPESEPSETSFESHDSERKPSSGITTPTTAEDDDPALERTHSGEYSATEKALELLHPNTSQSTIRKPPESPTQGTSVKSRVAVRTLLEGQSEVDEDALTDGEHDHHAHDHSSLHLPLALHSRTPSRTKRRSVSSNLSPERRHSHHSTSSQWQTFPPEDYLGMLNAEQPARFSTPSEKYLLQQLSDMGFDTGQLVHSVENDACDISAAMWWILRAKQLERGETDQVVEARAASAARRRERAAAYAREERRRAREAGANSKDVSRNASRDTSPVPKGQGVVTFKDEATPIPGSAQPVPSASLRGVSSLSPSLDPPPPLPPKADLVHAVPAIRQPSDAVPQPSTPTREPRDTPTRPDLLSSPSDSSPNRERSAKGRSPSMTMLQRATSVLAGGSWKGEEKAVDDSSERKDKDDKRSTSPTKLTKPTRGKLTKSESDSTLLTVTNASPATITPSRSPEPLPKSNGSSRGKSPVALGLAELSATNPPSVDSAKSKAGKKDSLWSTFRLLFNEDKRRRKRDGTDSPAGKAGPAVVLSRGIAARSPHVNRVVAQSAASRRASMDVRPAFSRRSSSVNSRRSSVTSAHLPADLTLALHDGLSNVTRRPSQRSHGSQTPTSDREYADYPSRPGSSHSLQKGSTSRMSSQSLRSPTIQSDGSGRAPASPLHNYHRRPPSGMASTRIRHIKVIPESQVPAVLRSASVASSVRSAASSRASSIDRGRPGHFASDDPHDSDYDTGQDDVSLRSKRRRSSDDRYGPLAQQIQRTRSPLAHGHGHGHGHGHHNRTTLKPKPVLRDVFQHKEDDWIDEDEAGPSGSFAGGLGQLGSGANWGARWVNGMRAAAHPSSGRDIAKRASGAAKKRPLSEGRPQGIAAVEEEDEEEGAGLAGRGYVGRGKGPDTSAGQGAGEGQGQGPRRRGLPATLPSAPPVVYEEDEEEE